MSQIVIEYAPFAVKPGVTEAELLKAAERVQTGFMAHQPGCLAREVLREGPGRYADIIWWESREAAEAAMPKAMESVTCQPYFALMVLDESAPEAGLRHFTRLLSFGSARNA